MTASGSIPRWRSLSPATLFSGPWEVLLPSLLVGALAAFAWAISPLVRVAAVTDWRLAAVVGGAVTAMIAVRAFARVWSDARGAWPFVFGMTVAGGLALAAASQTIFAPALARASECAPLVAWAESATGRFASYALPVVTWIAWSYYLLTRFPHVSDVTQLMHGRDSRYEPYARALKTLLPFRLILSAVVVAGAVLLARMTAPPRAMSGDPQRLVAQLAQPAVALADRADGAPLAQRLAVLRQDEEEKALTHLAAFELDEARPAVRRCACEWLLPGDAVDGRIAAAEGAFRTLDREIDDWAFAWKPSASTGAAILRLLPFGAASDVRPPLYPLLWRVTPPLARANATVVAGEPWRVTYRGETVMLVRRSTIATESGDALVDVSVKILGQSGRDASLPDVVSSRVGSAPVAGPCPIDGGSYCALWDAGRLKLRLAPDPSDAVSPAAPMWLSLFDPAYFAASRAQCCATSSRAASRSASGPT